MTLFTGGLVVALALFSPFEGSFRFCGITHGVPSWLLKGAAHETSHFDPTAHGPTNDWGVLQVIESNAPGCGISVSDLTTPSKNICCAAWLMNRNISRVKELGAHGDDALLLALMRNNMGGGNVDGKIAAGHTTWESFKAATPNWVGKHHWVETMWSRAQSYRWGEYIVDVAALTAFGLIAYWAFAR